MASIDKRELADIKPGPIAWMAGQPVAANLLMLVFLLGGFFIYSRTTKEVFPAFSLDTISIRMGYPGASPAEVEQGIILALEDAVGDIEGLGEITSTANEGAGSLTAEVLDPDEIMRILQDVKTAVDSIITFPVDAEDLTVSITSRKRNVLTLTLYGSVNEWVLREAAEQVRDVLDQDRNIGAVELSGTREFEIHIEVSQENLRRYGLSLSVIAAKIRETALELGGGSLDTESGAILVRMSERRDNARQFRDIPVIIKKNGSQILLGDIATIREGFEDSNNRSNYATYNGKPAILFDVFRIGEQTPISVSQTVKSHVETLNASLPGDLQLAIVSDRSRLFEQRGTLLLKNGFWGLLLVIGFLALFLDIRLAFWVSMGIPISFLGAFLFFPMTDFTVNIISMFAFIISLGIVVDDAIVTGENIYHYRQEGYPPLKAAVTGAREISIPVTISVLTNMVAFVPLMFIPGIMGKIFSIIPVVVIAAFFISLIESLFVLPAHLAFKKAETMPRGLSRLFTSGQKGFNKSFEYFLQNRYEPFLQKVIHYRYLALASFLAVLAGVGGYVFSGRMGMQLFPRVESDYAFASATLKVGAPLKNAQAVQQKLVKAAQQVIDENGEDKLSKGIFSVIRENSIEVRAYLTDPDIRPVSTAEFTSIWRKKVGEIAGLENLSFLSNRGGPGSGTALTVELSHRDIVILDEAAVRLAAALAEFPNTKDIDDSAAQGKKQYDFKMKELGYTLGMTTRDVARQVRSSFYGSEAFKQQRGRNEVRVLVRLPEEQRSSEYYLKNLIMRAPNGSEVLLRDVVTMVKGRAYTTINRRDGRRNIHVTADVDPPSQAGQIITALTNNTLLELQQRYPGLAYSFEGRHAEIRDSITSLFWGLGAVLFIIYAMLAVFFGSYSQPFMVLIAIPFGAVGAVAGHFIMGYSLSVLSLFGMMALAGVVVNDSLIMIDFANRKKEQGIDMFNAVLQAGIQRFRPILLTTLTTFVGLAPIIFETSRQARFLIPMALSLGFGILFAIFITLVLVPALYMIIEDIKKLLLRARAH
jgi:multidrug efflux pump subunit AcrB